MQIYNPVRRLRRIASSLSYATGCKAGSHKCYATADLAAKFTVRESSAVGVEVQTAGPERRQLSLRRRQFVDMDHHRTGKVHPDLQVANLRHDGEKCTFTQDKADLEQRYMLPT